MIKKVCYTFVVLMLFIGISNSIAVNGEASEQSQQETEIVSEQSSELRPQAWRLSPTELNTDSSSMQSTDNNPPQPQQSNEWNGQEPMRRRRRKRKRRPQQQLQLLQQQQREQDQQLQEQDHQPQEHDHHPQEQDQQLQEQVEQHPTIPGPVEPTIYWNGEIDDDPSALQERDGIHITINEQPPPQQTENTENRPAVLRNWNKKTNAFVQGIVLRVHNDDDDVAQQSRQVENIQTPYNDRRAPDADNRDRSYRKPYSVAKKQEEIYPAANPGAIDLKNLLKKNGGLSLSEILQQQNLSLDDLLKGKQNALQVLQHPPTPSELPPLDSTTTTKATRRIPNKVRPVSVISSTQEVPQKPHRRTNVDEQKPLRRVPTFSKPKTPETLAPPTEITAEEIKIAATVASFMGPQKSVGKTAAEPTTFTNLDEIVTISNFNRNQAPAVRRLPVTPVDRPKQIKEIVSGIRPDLHNSSTRKRLVPIKVKSPLNVTTTARPTIKASAEARERLPPRWGNGYRLKSTPPSPAENSSQIIEEKQEMQHEVVLQVVNQPVEVALSTIATTTTTTAAASTERSLDISKEVIKSRLALRPRLKSPKLAITTTTSSESPIYTTTEEASTEAATEPIIIEEFEVTTIFPQEEIDFSNPDDIKDVMEQLEPENPDINAIEQLPAFEESAIRADAESEIETIEQLFENVFNGEDSPIAARSSEEAADPSENVIQKIQRISKVDVTERNPSLFTDITSVRSVDDKTDILELLEDRRSGARLYKVLAQRNMTLNELLEHRQRGSSQLHLAEIFLNKTKVPKEIPVEKVDILTAFENFPTFNLNNVKSVKPDEIKTDSEGSSYFTSIINIKPTDEIYKAGRALKKPIPKLDENTDKSTDFYDQWSYSSQDDNSIDDSRTQKGIVSSSRLSPLADNDEATVYKGIEQIENEVARAHDIVDLELSGLGYKRNTVMVESAHSIPVGVRSAIIASSSIVGISLLIFIIIFVTCRWRQRRKKTFNYSENFQAVRSRLPILSRESGSSKRSTSPPGVFPGGARNSKINTMDPNSPEVQEYLYDAMRKPFQ